MNNATRGSRTSVRETRLRKDLREKCNSPSGWRIQVESAEKFGGDGDAWRNINQIPIPGGGDRDTDHSNDHSVKAKRHCNPRHYIQQRPRRVTRCHDRRAKFKTEIPRIVRASPRHSHAGFSKSSAASSRHFSRRSETRRATRRAAKGAKARAQKECDRLYNSALYPPCRVQGLGFSFPCSWLYSNASDPLYLRYEC